MNVSPANLPSKDLFKSIPADYFIENAGQLSNEDVRFYTTSGDMQIGFAESAVLIKMVERQSATAAISPKDRETMRSLRSDQAASRGVLIRLDFEGSNKVTPQGIDPLPHRTNFLIGNDPTRWRTNVRSFREVVYADLYHGIDLVYRLGPNGLKYDFLVRPGADPSRIRMTYEGVESLDVDPGSLVLRTAAGEVRDENLVATSGGDPVRCAFVRVDVRTTGFACEGWGRAHPLVIDPLLWSTYLGGSGHDSALAVALDASGNTGVAGYTESADFPVTPGAHDVTLGTIDAFVAKLSPDGSSLLWATYLGGGSFNFEDCALALAFDASGNPLVTGRTWSADFPVTLGAYDTTYNGFDDAFVTKLSADGSSLLWSTYLGGGDTDVAHALALDTSGYPVVAGYTFSADFPATPGTLDATLNGTVDAFVAKLGSGGSSLLWATYLGAGSDDRAFALALNASANPVIAGWTSSADFPATPGAYDMAYNGGNDAFVAELSADGSSLPWATYLGGSGDEGDFSLRVVALALDVSGSPVVAGSTGSADFPATPGAYDVTYNGGDDAFVAKLSPGGSSLLWATYLGGSVDDLAHALAIDSSDNPVVGGETYSGDFPAIPGAYDTTYNGGTYDAFVARLSADGSSLPWATYLGADADELANALIVDAFGSAFVVGKAIWDFPTNPGAYDVTYNGWGDAFVAKLDLTTPPDLVPPTVFITSPSSGTWLSGSAVSVSGMAWDSGSPPDRVEVSCDGGATWNSATAKTSWTYVCTIATDGTHFIHARAFDEAGWESTQAIVFIYMDLTPPAVTIDFPTDGTWFNVTDVTVSGVASDTGSGLSRVEVSCDNGTTWSTATGTASWSCTCLSLPAGSSAVHARSIDLVGWESIRHIMIVNVDLTPPIVTITSPADGTWLGATNVPISGTATDVGGGLDRVEVSCDGGATWNVASGVVSWSHTCTGLLTGSNSIQASSFDLVGWESIHANITVNVIPNPPAIVVTYPSGGEVWSQGDSHSVTWTASDNEDAPSALLVWINYTSGAGSGSICGPVAGNLGSCSWNLPTITATDVVVNGTVIDSGGLKGYDDSGPFTIRPPPNTPPTVSITAPSGGEVWIQGSSHTVTWTASDIEDAPSALLVWINYTSGAGSGSICGPVAGSVGSCAWTTPASAATDVVMNGTIIDTGGLRGYDESGQFTIQAPPPVNTPPTATITSPTGGEEFLKGSSHTITWTMDDDQDINANLTIYINYTTGGVTNQIVAALKGQLSFAWTLPSIEANDVVVNITVIDTGGLKGWSQSGPFTIKAPSPPPPPPPDLLSQYWWLLVIVVAVVIVLLLLLAMKRRKPKEEEDSSEPPASPLSDSPR